MGVDYTGNYGIGIQVFMPEFEEGHEYYEYSEDEWLEDILFNTEYSYFEVGSGAYSGNRNQFYIEINNPFENGYNIQDKVDKLMDFLKTNDIPYEGKVNVIGGLNVW